MKQKSSHILMIQPIGFGFNDQTFASNSFQNRSEESNSENIQNKALEEFDQFVSKLKSVGIRVDVFADNLFPNTPDSIFPNNWISFHENNTFVLYPMLAENRRSERRTDIIESYKNADSNCIDLSSNENSEYYLEGTGSIVFDYENKIAYANISGRTNKNLFEELSEKLGYTPVCFRAIDEKGNAIYHTNVMMCIGKGFCVLCKDCIPDKNELENLEISLKDSGLEIIEIKYKQLNAFAGNMYQLFNDRSESFIVMSEQAYLSLQPRQIFQLEKYGSLLYSPLYTIEKYGGGSARCMMADVRI